MCRHLAAGDVSSDASGPTRQRRATSAQTRATHAQSETLLVDVTGIRVQPAVQVRQGESKKSKQLNSKHKYTYTYEDKVFTYLHENKLNIIDGGIELKQVKGRTGSDGWAEFKTATTSIFEEVDACQK